MATTVTDTYQQAMQTDYKLRSIIAPKYKHVKIPLNNFPGAIPPFGNTSSQTLEWKLPTQVYNLSRSYIGYNMNVAGVGGLACNTWEDIFEMGSSITFGSAGGVDLVNLQYLQNYSKIARKIATNLDDFMGNDDMSGLYKANTTAGAAAAGAINVVPGGYNRINALSFAAPDNYLETKYAKGSAALNTTLNVYRQYPLGAFTGTLLAVDRDFYSPVEQYLRVQAGIGQKMAFGTTSLDGAVIAGGTMPGAVTLNNVYLYLAVEQNVLIKAELMEKYAKGELTFRIPYTTAFRNVGGSAGNQTNVQIQLSQQYGKRLKRIMHTVWNPTESGATAYDCANYDGEKILTFQTFLDNLPMQDRIMSCARPAGLNVNQDDWLENKKFLDRRSCILSKEMYQINWFHIDQFFEPHDKDGSLPEVNLDEGLAMDTPKQWMLSALTPVGGIAGLIHYTYAEFAREIMVTDAGPIFV